MADLPSTPATGHRHEWKQTGHYNRACACGAHQRLRWTTGRGTGRGYWEDAPEPGNAETADQFKAQPGTGQK